MVKQKTWQEFRDSGALWFANSILHAFGWAIVIEYDRDTGEEIKAYPARVKFRGFDEKSNSEGYIKLSEYMNTVSEQLLKESKE